MKIKQVLALECVEARLKATNKDEAIRELAEMMSKTCLEVSADEIYKILVEREQLGSTGIGNGVAIPHGKLPTLNQIVTGFARSVEGVAFDSQDGKPAHLFFVLLAPGNAASLHLKTLARLSRLLKDVHFRNKLIEAKDGTEIFNDIISEDEKF